MIILGQTGLGRDFVLDDISFTEVGCDTICANSAIDTAICIGDTLLLDAGSGSNFGWSPDYNISDPGAQIVAVWPSIDTSYIVYYQSDTGCQVFDTIHVSVSNPIVVAAINDTTICASDILQLSASGANSYSWSPTSAVSNGNISSPNFTGTDSTELIVTGTDLLGCMDSDTIVVNLLPCCGAFTQVSIANNYSCVGQAVQINSASISGSNPVYSWDFGPNAQPSSYTGATPPGIVFDEPGTHEISLILTDDCGVDTARGLVYILDEPSVEVANDTFLCIEDAFIYELGTSYIPDYSYVWTPSTNLDDPNSANPTATLNSSETYILEVTDIFGCVTHDTVVIELELVPDLITDSLIEANYGATVILDVEAWGSWIWSPAEDLSCTVCQNPSLVVTEDGMFVVSSENGNCEALDTVYIVVNGDSDCFYTPDAFSPNEDGANDGFYPIGATSEFELDDFAIYNRWGELVHHALTPWDGYYKGEKQNIGVYVFTLEYVCFGEKKNIIGNVTLIR